ncbi:hypothetical protein E2C01_089766 [Portunus trituberculatus]|uniref:Uncharacterized protein n=1 Tax=Portunus trituberculatus TaxID=210409 RepID=A0A5B7J9Q0_PORTR|nr:hypothetical protein [Portunus trituberculatus]
MLGRVSGECYSFELGLVHDALGEALWPPGGGLAKCWGQDKDQGTCVLRRGVVTGVVRVTVWDPRVAVEADVA